jgi:hypothetical protein
MNAIKTIVLGSSVIVCALASQQAFGERDFRCATRNNTCVIYDNQAVTGDKIGFFTERGELIATGQVMRMQGRARSVQLQQVLGPVNSQAETFAMLDSPSKVATEEYRLYRHPTPMAVAAQVGFATFGAGGDAKGYEATAELIRRKFIGKVDGFVRGGVYSFSGTARNVFSASDQAKFTATAGTALGGIGFTLFSQNDFLMRTEVGLGLAFTSAKINGSSSDAKSEDWGYGVKSGIAPHARGAILAGYKFSGWQLEGGFAQGYLAGKAVSSIGAGLLINMK